MTQHLVITAVGTDRPGICNEVVRLVTQAGCNIIDSRIAMFGKEFTLLMLISGSQATLLASKPRYLCLANSMI